MTAESWDPYWEQLLVNKSVSLMVATKGGKSGIQWVSQKGEQSVGYLVLQRGCETALLLEGL